MPRDIPSALYTAMCTEGTSIAELVKITPVVGSVLAFTNYTENLTVDAVTYLARPGMQVSVVQGKINLEIDTSTAQGFFQTSVITLADILKGKFDDAFFERMFVNADDLSDGSYVFHSGYIGRVDVQDNAFQAEFRGLAAALSQPVGRVVSKRCDVRTVGDSRCNFNLATTQSGTGINFTQTLTVDDVATQDVFTVTGVQSGTNTADGSSGGDWWTYGTLVWATGDNAGYSSDIAQSEYSGGIWTITLVNAPGADVQSGDTFSAKAGCDRSPDHCQNKFKNASQTNGNMRNFRGVPYLIGNDLYSPADKLAGQ